MSSIMRRRRRLISAMAQLIIELTGSRSEITLQPLPIDDPIQRCPDISQAKAELDWQPRTALKPGLQRTIDYFDKLLRAGANTEKPKSVAASGSAAPPGAVPAEPPDGAADGAG